VIQMIVDLASDERGNVVCVTSTRAESRTQGTAAWRLVGERWEEVARWKGKMITAVAACGGWVMCGGLDGALYGVELEKGEVKQTKVEVEAEFGAATGVSEHRALFAGGAGVGLVSVDVPSMEVKRKALGEYGVSRPGRTVHAMAKWGSKVLMGGAKNLVYVYEDDRIKEIAGKASFEGKEFLVDGVAGVGGEVFVSGIMSPLRKLYRHAGGSAWEEVQPPTTQEAGGAARICALGDRLLAGGESIYVREGSGWRRWCDSLAPERILWMTPAGAEKICVVTEKGESYLAEEKGLTRLSGLKG
jgi:hypothetical protein